MAISGIDSANHLTSAAVGVSGNTGKLSSRQQATARALKARDQKVRRHEEAHIAAGDGYIRGGAQYTYTTGPDGKQYATGGDVTIDTSPAATPEETAAKMEVVMQAALAPTDPSAQDRAVYAEAARAEVQARSEEQAASTSKTEFGETPSIPVQNIAMVALQKALGNLQPSTSAPTVSYQA